MKNSISRLACGIYFAVIFCSSCRQTQNDTAFLQKEIDSLKRSQNNRYTPGMGEIMTTIQLHHAKLWFAGLHQNWPLATFELGDIRSGFAKLQQFHGGQPEAKIAQMIIPPLDSVNFAIEMKNFARFRSSFLILTNTCNSCHQAVKRPYNVIIIPREPPVTNQQFIVQENK